MRKIIRYLYCDSTNLEFDQTDEWPEKAWCNNCQEFVKTYEDTDQFQRPDKVLL